MCLVIIYQFHLRVLPSFLETLLNNVTESVKTCWIDLQVFTALIEIINLPVLRRFLRTGLYNPPVSQKVLRHNLIVTLRKNEFALHKLKIVS